MKVVLSRKGFDSTYGGQPSPIFPDKTLLSFPIPSKKDNLPFTNIYHKNHSYYDIIKELKPKSRIKDFYSCHLDPDIRQETISRTNGWRGLFGQRGAAQTHLTNQNVGLNDLFLYFGWFKETIETSDGLQYKPGSPDLHIIFGYLQVGKIYMSSDNLPPYAKNHPHANMYNGKNNCIYEASEHLSFNKSLPGYGTFKFNKNLVLTKEKETRSKWDLPDFFKNVNISYHSPKSFKNGYFDSAKIGQEFIIEADDNIIKWVKDLFQY